MLFLPCWQLQAACGVPVSFYFFRRPHQVTMDRSSRNKAELNASHVAVLPSPRPHPPLLWPRCGGWRAAATAKPKRCDHQSHSATPLILADFSLAARHTPACPFLRAPATRIAGDGTPGAATAAIALVHLIPAVARPDGGSSHWWYHGAAPVTRSSPLLPFLGRPGQQTALHRSSRAVRRPA